MTSIFGSAGLVKNNLFVSKILKEILEFCGLLSGWWSDRRRKACKKGKGWSKLEINLGPPRFLHWLDDIEKYFKQHNLPQLKEHNLPMTTHRSRKGISVKYWGPPLHHYMIGAEPIAFWPKIKKKIDGRLYFTIFLKRDYLIISM